jgi:hypothetical protein
MCGKRELRREKWKPKNVSRNIAEGILGINFPRSSLRLKRDPKVINLDKPLSNIDS